MTKANSIEGCLRIHYVSLHILTDVGNKKDNVTVIYSPWSNLKKDGSMVVGQVGFKDTKKVIWVKPP